MALWCKLHGKKTLIAAPTGLEQPKAVHHRLRGYICLQQYTCFLGIAAANILIENTDIVASTIHQAFDLDHALKTKLDMSSMDNKKVKRLHDAAVLMLDEARHRNVIALAVVLFSLRGCWGLCGGFDDGRRHLAGH